MPSSWHITEERKNETQHNKSKRSPVMQRYYNKK